jgi:hypothetical protein
MIREPGILRLLPEALPFYPYRLTDDGTARRPRTNRRNRKYLDRDDLDDDRMENEDTTSGGYYIPNAPITPTTGGALVIRDSSFTLFFFVDSTNRQSMNAIPRVSHWFRHALSRGEGEDGSNRVICVPNHPSPNEVFPDADPTIRAACVDHAAAAANDRGRIPCPMLLYSGFYHLPFHHPQRTALLRLLGATRVPSVVVVGNVDGGIVTRHGWEAIVRELGGLEEWIERDSVESKKCDDEEDEGRSSGRRFESDVVVEWGNGNSGLPLYWHLLSWIL